jgi:hypothetical protein
MRLRISGGGTRKLARVDDRSPQPLDGKRTESSAFGSYHEVDFTIKNVKE